MRPKFVALLALSALALVGCSADADPAPEPTVTAPVTATPSASADSSASQESGTDEEAFLAQLSTLSDKKEELPPKFQKKVTEKYMLDRGEMYCEMSEKDRNIKPITSGESTGTDNGIETRILMSAQMNLCPEPSSN